VLCPFGVRLGRNRLGNGKLSKLTTISKKRAESHPSGTPWNDGGQSFSTEERLLYREGARKVWGYLDYNLTYAYLELRKLAGWKQL